MGVQLNQGSSGESVAHSDFSVGKEGDVKGCLSAKSVRSKKMEQPSVIALKQFFEKEIERSSSESLQEQRKYYRRANTELDLRTYFNKPGDSSESDAVDDKSGEETSDHETESSPSVTERLLEQSGHSHKTSLTLDLSQLSSNEDKKKPKKNKGKERTTTIHFSEITSQKRSKMIRTASTNSIGSRWKVRHVRKSPFTGSSFEKPLLSIISPRYGKRRDYLSTTENQPQESTGFNLTSLPYISSKQGSFDKSMARFIRMAWKTNHKTEVSAFAIEEVVSKVCRKEIDELFQNEKQVPSSELQITESPRSKELLRIIQKSGVLLVPVIRRLKVIQRALHEYLQLKGEKSEWTEKLAGLLDELITPDIYLEEENNLGLEKGKDLGNFLALINNLNGRRGDRKMAEIIMKAFGDKASVRRQVMATLNKWNEPPKNLMGSLKKQVHKMSWENVAAMNIPFVQHEWLEDENSLYPISKITLSEIIRCFATENAVIMNQITINGKTFYKACDKGGASSSYSQKKFIRQLITAVYQAGINPRIKSEEVKAQVKRMFALRSVKVGVESEVLQDDPIPCLDLLRLCTMSAWGHGDAYLRQLFPGLFTIPYWTKLLQGIDCHITIAGPDDFAVKMVKSYGTYPRQLRTDSTSTAVDRDRLFSEIPVSWMLSPSDEGWKGVLNIPEEITIRDCANPKEKWDILKAIINFKDMELPESVNSPGTPRMRSSPRPTLTRSDLAARKLRTSEVKKPQAASSSQTKESD